MTTPSARQTGDYVNPNGKTVTLFEVTGATSPDTARGAIPGDFLIIHTFADETGPETVYHFEIVRTF